MRRTITLASTIGALLGSGLMPAVASADRSDCSKRLERNYSAYWHAVAHKSDRGKLRKDAQGRNIRKWGIDLPASAKRDWKPAPCHALRTSLGQLKRLQHPPRSPLLVTTAVPPAQRPSGVATASVRAPAGGTLAAIRACESGGNYQAVGGGGQFRGGYQFTYSTWASVGGSGDPAAASPAEQDRRAAMLYAQQGASPWPVCGR